MIYIWRKIELKVPAAHFTTDTCRGGIVVIVIVAINDTECVSASKDVSIFF